MRANDRMSRIALDFNDIKWDDAQLHCDDSMLDDYLLWFVDAASNYSQKHKSIQKGTITTKSAK